MAMIGLSPRHDANARRGRLEAAVLIGVLAAGISLGVAVAHAYDPRLDEALAALQKAAALVEASSPGVVSTHTQHKFDNERAKALDSIQDAMDHIAAAGLVADSDGGSQ
jgi:hypothetical protein